MIFYSTLTTGAKLKRGLRLISMGRLRRRPERAFPPKRYDFQRLEAAMRPAWQL